MKHSAPLGILVALAAIGVGVALDGGHIRQLMQPTAALIVFGGTLGAVMLQFPARAIGQSVRQLREVFLGQRDPAMQLINDLSRYALQARRNGLPSLEPELNAIRDPFLRKGLTLAIDGTRLADLRETMELAMHAQAEHDDLLPRVFESAGGYAPTIGILGAVMGLIQVMQKLDNMNEVGRGIAVAFVATLYGVGSANLLFLPCAGRLRILVERRHVLRELMLEGVLAIADRTNPRALESRLAIYLPPTVRLRPITLDVP